MRCLAGLQETGSHGKFSSQSMNGDRYQFTATWSGPIKWIGSWRLRAMRKSSEKAQDEGFDRHSETTM